MIREILSALVSGLTPLGLLAQSIQKQGCARHAGGNGEEPEPNPLPAIRVRDRSSL